jgi:hypothetical protein
MPEIEVYVARIDIGTSSGMIYSYEQIDDVKQANLRIAKICKIVVQTPDGFEMEPVNNALPFGDMEPDRLVLDAHATAVAQKGGRIYMRAARLIERLRSEPHLFAQLGPGVPY